MSKWKSEIDKILKSKSLETGIYYLASTDIDILREAAEYVTARLCAINEEEATRIDGPSPDIGSLIAAAGAISFFGTPRIVVLSEIAPASISDKDLKELCEVFESLENAVIVVSCIYKDKKTAAGKKAKQLFDTAKANGFAIEISKPTQAENIRYIEEIAAGLESSFEKGAATLLLEQAGNNRPLLKSETEKLCAISSYQTVTNKTVRQYGVHNIEADVFELSAYIISKNRNAAFSKLSQLFGLKYEPLAISGALCGTYTDMYRVRCGEEEAVPLSAIYKELGYKGSEYRLQKSKQNCRGLRSHELEDCILCLYKLDMQLKSSAVSNKEILVETAIAQLMTIGN